MTLLQAALADDGAGLRAMQETVRRADATVVLRIMLDRCGLLGDDPYHDNPTRMAANVAFQSFGRELLHWIQAADPGAHAAMLNDALADQLKAQQSAEQKAAEERGA
jgi:hypothetical protein